MPGYGIHMLGDRDLVSFPHGDNSTDTVFGGVHFNLTTLQYWNYTYYSNGTVSNGSKCYLTYQPYQPAFLFTNGSFLNATTCYSAVDPIGVRGYVGIAFAVLYALALMLSLTMLAKHGRLHLPRETRFQAIGRRWQWYWGCFVCACALISLLTNVDVDRYHVQELPIILTSFFWFLICQGTVAVVWESVRHWGSWQERQFIDPNPFVYRLDDRRAKVEFYLPLWFYFWTWMNFFMVVPRSWNFLEEQRSPELTATDTVPAAMGARFKAGGFCLLVAWFTIVVSLGHSVHHYHDRHRGILNRIMGFLKVIPPRFILTIPLSLALVIYQILASFDWTLSLMRYGGIIAAIYAWGYLPSLLILFSQAVYGFFAQNEDLDLIAQRRRRGDAVNRDLGIVNKPSWWRRVKGEHSAGVREKISTRVNEVGRHRGIGRRVEGDLEREARLEAQRSAVLHHGDDHGHLHSNAIYRTEMSSMTPAMPPPVYAQNTELGPIDQLAASFSRDVHLTATETESSRQDGEPPVYPGGDGCEAGRLAPTSGPGRQNPTSSQTAPLQQVRSMLDV